MNAEQGTELWKYQYPTQYCDLDEYDNGPRCSPVVDGNRVYIYGADGNLVCLRAIDGKRLWQCDTFRQFGVVRNFFGVGSTPVIEQDLLIAIVGGSPPEDQKTPPGELDRVVGNGTGIVAFDKFTGEVKYTLINELASYASPIVATVQGCRRCFALCRGGVVVFFPDTGRVNFRKPYPCVSLQAVNASTPVIVGNEVFISEAYGPGSCLFSVEPGGYGLLWHGVKTSRKKVMQTQFNTVVYHDGYLYGCSHRTGRHGNRPKRARYPTGSGRCDQGARSRVGVESNGTQAVLARGAGGRSGHRTPRGRFRKKFTSSRRLRA